MLDDKLDDEVWITVVATGYGERRPPRREEENRGLSGFTEPRGEPRVRRQRSSIDVDVPEFIPRF